ncbi:MAG: flagellin, partial [Ligilactobacillus ruminis]|nr:flagellin [Ligilactobacillus ruminis]
MRINTNVAAMNTYSRLTAANTAKSNSLAKLSSGSR